MVKNFKFGDNETITVKGEKLSGINLTFDAKKTDGTVCDIKDLNTIGLDIKVTRDGQDSVYIHQGYLDDFIHALYGQTTRFAICKTSIAGVYNMNLDLGGILNLTANDELEVKINAHKSESFSNLSLNNSSITFETIPTTQDATPLPIIRVTNIGAGETTYDKPIYQNAVKVLVATDYDASYTASEKSKIQTFTLTGDVEITDEDGVFLGTEKYEKSVSENLLVAQNRDMFDNNPDSEVQNMVVFLSENLLDNGRLRFKLDKPADSEAKVLSVHYDLF